MITRLTIDGMISVHAVRAIFTALTAVDGITRADVSLGGVELEHDGRATIEAIREAISVAGYAVRDVIEEKRTLPIL